MQTSTLSMSPHSTTFNAGSWLCCICLLICISASPIFSQITPRFLAKPEFVREVLSRSFFHLPSCNTSDIFRAKGVNQKGHKLLECECATPTQAVHGR